jgi:hypothetical protein
MPRANTTTRGPELTSPKDRYWTQCGGRRGDPVLKLPFDLPPLPAELRRPRPQAAAVR